jgi:hypothetical protein
MNFLLQKINVAIMNNNGFRLPSLIFDHATMKDLKKFLTKVFL